MQRSVITRGFVDEAIPFIDQAAKRGKPFYINLWPDDVHSPFWPPTAKWGNNKRELYLSVLEAMDEQLGKLFNHIHKTPSLRDNTIVMVCSDNGPELGAGVAGPFRGYKTHLYEGGVRSSLVAWGPGLVKPKNRINRKSVFSAIDLVPTLLDITGTPHAKGATYDGESVPDILLGKSEASRKVPIFFRRPPDRDAYYGDNDLPDLAVRDGKWKFLCEYDGAEPELYDMTNDRGEKYNIAAKHPKLVRKFSAACIAWHKSMPPDNGPQLVGNARRNAPRKPKKN